jgi:hypothetical protein
VRVLENRGLMGLGGGVTGNGRGEMHNEGLNGLN